MKYKQKFEGQVFMAGCGAVAQCALPILLKELPVEPEQITIMDFVDNSVRINRYIAQGVKFVKERITPENYKQILSKYLKSGDLFIDLAWEIDTCDLLQWCHDNNVRYVNSAVELWYPYKDVHERDPREFTLYVRQMKIREMIKRWGKNDGPTAIVDHGANPGLVSHFAKQGLIDIAQKLINEKPSDKRISDIKKSILEKNFAKLAQLLNIQVIHISERDSQITSQPKQMNEFVNTWSVEGIIEEGIAPAELGWGTHERYEPEGIMHHQNGPQNQICLKSRGVDTKVWSWVPSGEIIGMVIRHGEAFGISDYLTVWENGKAVYRPTVHYAYCVSDGTLCSLNEFKMRQFELQPKTRILNDDIIDGVDELGCLLMGHDFRCWWIGSILDIHEARKLVPHQNATTIQVATSVIASVNYMLNHPNEGVRIPDEIDYEEILEFSKPYLGKFVSMQVDWSPLTRKPCYVDYKSRKILQEDEWQFTTFLVD